MPAPLDGINVLDLSRGPVGGTTTMVLADFGADVVKIEPPAGDYFRSLPAAPAWLRGKRSVALDLGTEVGRDRLHALTADADVVVASFAPDGDAIRCQADFETLRHLNPRLIYCNISGWGSRGAYANYPAYEGVVAAKSGRMLAFRHQLERDGPAFAAVQVGGHAASQGAVQGIVAALFARETSGLGGLVETSILQGLIPYELHKMMLIQLAEREPANYAEQLTAEPGMPRLNYHPVMVAEGRWMQMANLLEHLFVAFLEATDLTDLFTDPRFQGPPALWEPDAIEEARDRILIRMQEHTVDEWMAIFHANGNVAAEPFLTAQAALDHPDMLANGDLVDIEHPRLGSIRQLAPIARLDETPGQASTAGSEVGADNGASFRTPSTTNDPNGFSTPAQGRPLEGITVLEFATIIATPLGTSMLADLGARVIKVEPTGSGDPYRALDASGIAAAKVNAAKESICIDLKSETGQALVRDLIARADAIVHNYRPGVPERLGIGYEQARAIQPDIVWVSANGYGPNSPSANRPSAHPVPGAVCGGAVMQAGVGMPPADCDSLDSIREAARQLMQANEANPDPNTSVVIASATTLALLARQRFGVGQRVFVNMLVANGYANADDFLRYEGKAPRPEVDAELSGISALYRLYEAQSGWVFLGVLLDEEWAALCQTIERPNLLTDARFATPESRVEHDSALVSELQAIFATRDADTWEALLVKVGVGCVRADAATPGQFWADDTHVRANGLAPNSEHRRLGNLRRWGPLVTVDGGPDSYGPGVLAGQHTDQILTEIGRSADEVAMLRETGVVWSE